MASNQVIKKELLEIIAWANGLSEKCRRTIKQIDEEVVSTSSNINSMDEHVATAVTKFRMRLAKKSK